MWRNFFNLLKVFLFILLLGVAIITPLIYSLDFDKQVQKVSDIKLSNNSQSNYESKYSCTLLGTINCGSLFNTASSLDSLSSLLKLQSSISNSVFTNIPLSLPLDLNPAPNQNQTSFKDIFSTPTPTNTPNPISNPTATPVIAPDPTSKPNPTNTITWGVNLSGLAFGHPKLAPGPNTGPGWHDYGVINRDYVSATPEELDYFKSKGLTAFRIGFRWERIQHSLYGDFDSTYAGYVDALVNAAAKRGLKILLDPHQTVYLEYPGTTVTGYYDVASNTTFVLGSAQLPYSAFADLWTKLAKRYKGNPGVYGYGLINEPHKMDIPGMTGVENWKQAAQAAINAIRAVDQNTPILVAGYHYGGAFEWAKVSDSLKNLTDPNNNLIYEAHQYLDDDEDGQYDDEGQVACSTIDPATRGPNRIAVFVNWLRANGKKGMIGEMGVPPDSCWLKIFEPTLDYISKSSDVLVSFQYFPAGPWWNNYDKSIEPTKDSNGNYVDKPQTAILTKYATQ
jgi:endoglucanase